MTLSTRWARHHRALGSTTDEAIRLAIALGAVRSVIRVVDRTVPPLTVDWAAMGDGEGVAASASYTDFAGHAIRLNPVPFKDTTLGHGDALDIVIGFGLHEASHSQESRDRYAYLIRKERHPNGKSMREVPAFEPMRIAAYLWNLVEDVRIERVTTDHWPGFEPYFWRMLEYLWSDIEKRHKLPTKLESDLIERLRVTFLACRYPLKFMPKDRKLQDEVAWWQAWQDDYLDERVDTPTTIRRGLDRLATDRKIAEELKKMTEAEKRERELGERLAEQLKRLVREGVVGTFEICASDQDALIPLDEATADEVRKYVRENLVEHRTIVAARGAENMPVLVRKPEETAGSRRAYVGRPDAVASALRAALVFRASAPQHFTKLEKSGTIDDEELWRWGTGDMRVFGSRVVESKPDVFMGLLVDMSGSMWGEKLTIAQRLAQLFVWAVHDQEGIVTQVWGHTADSTAHASEVFRLWEPGDSLSRLGLIEDLDHANNADGHAIAYVASQIALAEQPEKVLIVLSDGLPNAEMYGDEAAMQHVRAATRWAQSRGVRVIQVAIDPYGQRPQDQAKMFGEGNWVPYISEAALPRQIASLLGRYLS